MDLNEKKVIKLYCLAFQNDEMTQYIQENRYIGVYSLKNRIVFEIDTVELCIKETMS